MQVVFIYIFAHYGVWQTDYYCFDYISLLR